MPNNEETPSKSALKRQRKAAEAEERAKQKLLVELEEKKKAEAKEKKKAAKEDAKDSSDNEEEILLSDDEENSASAAILKKLDELAAGRKSDSKATKKLVDRLDDLAGRLGKLEGKKEDEFFGDSSDSESGDEVHARSSGRAMMVDDNFVLPEFKFEKSRNQHEYDFLREVTLVLADQESSLVDKVAWIKEAVETRAAILITAQEEGWSVASELDFFDSPKKAFMKKFQKELNSARKRASTKASLSAPKRASKRRSPASASSKVEKEPVRSSASSGFRKTNYSTPAACFVCGSSDHLANKCGDRWKPSGSGSGGKSGGSSRSGKSD